jgi:hypothetical protein
MPDSVENAGAGEDDGSRRTGERGREAGDRRHGGILAQSFSTTKTEEGRERFGQLFRHSHLNFAACFSITLAASIAGRAQRRFSVPFA